MVGVCSFIFIFFCLLKLILGTKYFLPLLDWRWVKYAPSVWATAALLHALELSETERVISLIKVSKVGTVYIFAQLHNLLIINFELIG